MDQVVCALIEQGEDQEDALQDEDFTDAAGAHVVQLRTTVYYHAARTRLSELAGLNTHDKTTLQRPSYFVPQRCSRA